MPKAPLLLEEELKNGIDFDPTKLCLEYVNARVQTGWCDGNENQQWEVVHVWDKINPNNLVIKNMVDPDMCLDLTDGKQFYTAALNLYKCTRGDNFNPNQIWFKAYFKESINFQIQLGTNPKWCLDAGTPMKPGNQVTLWGCDSKVLG